MTTPNLITTKNCSVEAGKKQKLKDPNAWFIEKFPAVYARYNMPLETAFTGKPKVLRVKQLSDVFFAAVFGELGFPDAPTYYTQGSFYTYNSDVGIYEKISDGVFETRLCELIQGCAKHVKSKKVDTDKLMFDLSNSSRLSGVVKRAKALLEKADTFFDNSDADFIPCNNGMLRIEDRNLLAFSHRYRIRNKLDVDYTIGAKCPLFSGKLLAEALDPDQMDMAQRWSGMALLGANVDHRILVIKGNAGAGKSTFINVVIGIVGHHNIGELRTDQLGGRFELGNLVGKRVLIGNDVPSDFLLQKGTSKLKSMVAGDPISAEIKGVTGQISMKGDFNIAIASNGVVSVRIDILKIDTEGFEFEVLKGLKENFNKVNFVYFEHHYDDMIKKNYTFSDIHKLLDNSGFVKRFKSRMPFRKSFEYIYENSKN